MKVDIVLVQVTVLPKGGFTAGVISDFSGALIKEAPLVIALVNRTPPLTEDDAGKAFGPASYPG